MNLLIIWTTIIVSMLSVVAGMYVDEGQNHYNKAIYKDWESLHGYVQVRPGAHIFYWLFFANGTKEGAIQKPLIIWIQGGPGFAASGVGNFGEIGPLDMNLEPRNHTWVKRRNLLLIDHPVGTGFSYVTNSSLYVKTDRELGDINGRIQSWQHQCELHVLEYNILIRTLCAYPKLTSYVKGIYCLDHAMDLSKVIKVFFRRHKEFRKTPTYLFGQSYGGKLCPRLGLYLHTAIEKMSLKMNFKGIGIGGGWVDPRESIAVQARFLYFSGAIDRDLYITSSRVAKKLARSIDRHDYYSSGVLDDLLFRTLNEERMVNFNNVYAPSPYPALENLNVKVNRRIKPMLVGVNQSLTWSYLSTEAYDHLKDTFLLSSTSFLETLLNKTKLKIAVYNGNLDVVTPLAGACNWVHKLKWPGAMEFRKAKRYSINGENNGYYKKAKNLSFWWVFGAGHWIPEENPVAMEQILRYVMSDD